MTDPDDIIRQAAEAERSLYGIKATGRVSMERPTGLLRFLPSGELQQQWDIRDGVSVRLVWRQVPVASKADADA